MDKKRLAQLGEITAHRKQEREANFSTAPRKKNEKDKNVGNALSSAEKYRTMV